MKRARKVRVTLTCDFPLKATNDDVADYLIGALESWGRGGDPDDPMAEGIKVRVSAFRGERFLTLEPQQKEITK